VGNERPDQGVEPVGRVQVRLEVVQQAGECWHWRWHEACRSTDLVLETAEVAGITLRTTYSGHQDLVQVSNQTKRERQVLSVTSEAKGAGVVEDLAAGIVWILSGTSLFGVQGEKQLFSGIGVGALEAGRLLGFTILQRPQDEFGILEMTSSAIQRREGLVCL
jgi:hypothetical protein